MSVKHQTWHVASFHSIFRLPKRFPYIPKAPSFSGGSRSKHRETSREALLEKAKEAAATDRRVPKGCLAVYVGPAPRRFVVPARCLAMPEFKTLMDMVAEEVGFEHKGGLHIPCDEEYFEEVLARCLDMKNKRKKL